MPWVLDPITIVLFPFFWLCWITVKVIWDHSTPENIREDFRIVWEEEHKSIGQEGEEVPAPRKGCHGRKPHLTVVPDPPEDRGAFSLDEGADAKGDVFFLDEEG